VPDYVYEPDATALVWDWLSTQPGLLGIRFVPVQLPAETMPGVRRWRCEIVAEPARVATGEGDSRQTALCYAVLALAQPPH